MKFICEDPFVPFCPRHVCSLYFIVLKLRFSMSFSWHRIKRIICCTELSPSSLFWFSHTAHINHYFHDWPSVNGDSQRLAGEEGGGCNIWRDGCFPAGAGKVQKVAINAAQTNCWCGLVSVRVVIQLEFCPLVAELQARHETENRAESRKRWHSFWIFSLM